MLLLIKKKREWQYWKKLAGKNKERWRCMKKEWSHPAQRQMYSGKKEDSEAWWVKTSKSKTSKLLCLIEPLSSRARVKIISATGCINRKKYITITKTETESLDLTLETTAEKTVSLQGPFRSWSAAFDMSTALRKMEIRICAISWQLDELHLQKAPQQPLNGPCGETDLSITIISALCSVLNASVFSWVNWSSC